MKGQRPSNWIKLSAEKHLPTLVELLRGQLTIVYQGTVKDANTNDKKPIQGTPRKNVCACVNFTEIGLTNRVFLGVSSLFIWQYGGETKYLTYVPLE